MKMNLNPPINFIRRSRQAFTLPELTIAMGVFLLLITAVISTHVFGLKMYEVARAKLGTSDKARKAISLLGYEIRRAKRVQVGNVSGDIFTPIALNATNKGNAIQIYTTSLTNNFVRYFRDTDKKLKRMTNNVVTVVAGSITNNSVFTKEDAFGTIQTNDTGKYVIGLTLKFYELEFMRTSIGSGGFYDSYQLQTKIAPRN